MCAGQCVVNAECTAKGGGKCKCFADFYTDTGECKERKKDEEPCTGTV